MKRQVQSGSSYSFINAVSNFATHSEPIRKRRNYMEKGLLHDLPAHILCAILLVQEDRCMRPDTEELRKKYMDNPLEGMTSEDIRFMSGDNLLDMDYFLKEDD